MCVLPVVTLMENVVNLGRYTSGFRYDRLQELDARRSILYF